MFYFATVAPEGRKQWPDVAISHLTECDSKIYVISSSLPHFDTLFEPTRLRSTKSQKYIRCKLSFAPTFCLAGSVVARHK